MTTNPDDDQPSRDPEDGRGEGNPKLDLDAAWQSIIDNYGERAEIEDAPDANPEADPEAGPNAIADAPGPPTFTVFERRWEPPAEPEPEPEPAWAHEEHFVPPEPPPVPPIEPRRKLAWIGLFGAPTMMLLAVIFGWHFASWFAFLLAAAFVGGFGYLIFTMPRNGDDTSGDNGAVV